MLVFELEPSDTIMISPNPICILPIYDIQHNVKYIQVNYFDIIINVMVKEIHSIYFNQPPKKIQKVYLDSEGISLQVGDEVYNNKQKSTGTIRIFGGILYFYETTVKQFKIKHLLENDKYTIINKF